MRVRTKEDYLRKVAKRVRKEKPAVSRNVLAQPDGLPRKKLSLSDLIQAFFGPRHRR